MVISLLGSANFSSRHLSNRWKAKILALPHTLSGFSHDSAQFKYLTIERNTIMTRKSFCIISGLTILLETVFVSMGLTQERVGEIRSGSLSHGNFYGTLSLSFYSRSISPCTSVLAFFHDPLCYLVIKLALKCDKKDWHNSCANNFRQL